MNSIIVFYDNWCSRCTNFSNCINKIDFFKKINFIKLRNLTSSNNSYNLNINKAKYEMASFYKNKWYYGYDSIYLISTRIPLFWLILPFLFLLKITKIGNLLYLNLAVKRKIIPLHCDSSSCKL